MLIRASLSLLSPTERKLKSVFRASVKYSVTNRCGYEAVSIIMHRVLLLGSSFEGDLSASSSLVGD